MTKDKALEIITDWKFKWMDVKGTDERDRANYYSRAFGVDANMKHDLARMISEAAESEILELREKLAVMENSWTEYHDKLTVALGALETIANEDYRGNRSQSSVTAFNALKKLRSGK